MTKTTDDERFIAAVKAMEKRTARVSAFAIVDPTNPQHYGRAVISYPADGAGRLYAIAWLPGQSAENDGFETMRHSGWANGYGYDKETGAMAHAEFYNLKTDYMGSLEDSGKRWDDQLRDAGYIVFHTV